MKKIFPGTTVLAATLCLLVVAGCEQDKGEKVGGDAAVKVNGRPIAAEQVAMVMSRFGNVPADHAQQVEKQILSQLVDQELLAQLALEKKLDQDPKVAMMLDGARREILARAYLEQPGGAPQVTPEQVKAFYDKYPALFKDRRIFNVKEMTVAAPPDILPRLQDELAKAKSLDEVGQWFKEQNIPFMASAGAKPVEHLQLAPDALEKFQAAKAGQIFLVPGNGGLRLLQMLSYESQPLDEKAATPVIEKILREQGSAQARARELKERRDKAKIEYLGRFAQNDAKAPSIPPQVEKQPGGAAGK